MKMQITSRRAPIPKGRIVDVWYFGSSKNGNVLWTFGADDGENTFQVTLDDAKVIDGDLTDMVFKQTDWPDSSFVLHSVLADDPKLYEGIVEFDAEAYAEFHRRRKLLYQS